MPDRFDRLVRLFGAVPTIESQKRKDEASASHLPTGRWLQEGVYALEQAFSLEEKVGKKPLLSLPQALETLKPWGSTSPLVFLDLETTGLAGGTGTYAFLCGIGTLEERHFRVRQIFLSSPAFEQNWLETLQSLLPKETGFATYNGKRFDMPLLLTRFALLRSNPSWTELGHLDLLPLARSLFRKQLPSCSLFDVESRILGLKREGDDVPGWQVPQLYAEFLLTRDASNLRGVFYHNRMDILAMAALAVHVSDLLLGKESEARSLLSAGEVWSKRGHAERAVRLWEACTCLHEGQVEALWRLGHAARKEGRYEKAASLWEEALSLGQNPPPTELYIDLAKLYEHRLKQPHRALERAREALRLYEKSHPRAFWDARDRLAYDALKHRVDRLERRFRLREGPHLSS